MDEAKETTKAIAEASENDAAKTAASSDAALDTAIAAAEEKAEAKSQRLRDSDGKFKKKAEQKPDDTQTETASDESDPETTPEVEIDAERQQTALKALQRYGASKNILNLATEGDEDAIAWGEKLAKIQSDYDKDQQEKAAIKRELAELKKTTGQTEDGSRSDGGKSPPDQLDVDSLIRPLAQRLEEATGEDLSEHVRTSFSGLLKAIDENSKSAIADRDQKIEAMNKRFEQMEIDRARDALVSEYPQLKDADTWQKVKSELDSLPESESRPDVLTRLDHASRIILAPDIAKQARSERKNRARDDGSPAPNGRRVPPEGKSVSDLQDEMLDAKLEGDQKRFESLQSELESRL